MGHSVNAITFRLGKSLLWRLLLISPISLNFFFFNFSRSFLIYYRYINYLFKIKYFKIFYKKGFFFSHLTLRRNAVNKYFLKLYVLDTFFLRLKKRIRSFLLRFSTPLRFKSGMTRSKNIRASGLGRFVSKKRRGYPTFFFKKIFRARSNNQFNQLKMKKTEPVASSVRVSFTSHDMFGLGRSRGLFDFLNENSNFFFFYNRSTSFLNLNSFFNKSIIKFSLKQGVNLCERKRNNINSTRNQKFVKSGSHPIANFPVNAQFLAGFDTFNQTSWRKPFRKNNYSFRNLKALKKMILFRSVFLNFRRNLQAYTSSIRQFFGYDVFRVYKYRTIQAVLRTISKASRRSIALKKRKYSSNIVFFKDRDTDQQQYIDSRFSGFGVLNKITRSSAQVSSNSLELGRTSWQYARKNLTFFNKIFFFRFVQLFSKFFSAVNLSVSSSVDMFKLIFVVFFKKFVRSYLVQLSGFGYIKGGRRARKFFKFKKFFKRFSRKHFLRFYFSFLNFFSKIFKVRKIYLHFKNFAKSRDSKFFFRFGAFVRRLVFFLSVTSFRFLVKKNFRKYLRCVYNQNTFKFAKFLQFKLARLTNCKNFANLNVKFVPLSCHSGITPDVYVNFLRLKIRRRFSFKSLIRPFIKGLRFMRFLRGVYGLGNGRFTRRQRASTVKVSKGKISFSTVSAYLLYSFLPVVTRYGTCGVHIFFNFRKSKVRFKYKVGAIFKVY